MALSKSPISSSVREFLSNPVDTDYLSFRGPYHTKALVIFSSCWILNMLHLKHGVLGVSFLLYEVEHSGLSEGFLSSL